MKVLSVIEHAKVPILEHPAPRQHAISIGQAEALERLGPTLPARSMSVGRRSVRFAQYCGVISVDGLAIEILPKIHGLESDQSASKEVLVRMLQQARQLNPKHRAIGGVALQKHTLLDIFVLHFCESLQSAISQGFFRAYQQVRENQPVLRGRLILQQQLKQNLVHRERLYCQFDEFSVNNLHNQVIKSVLRNLKRLPIGLRVHKRVNELYMRFDAVGDIHATVETLNNLLFDRTTDRFREVFRQVRWFLEGLKPDVTAGAEHCVTILFDMNRLFETWVGIELRKLALRSNLRIRTQGPQRYLATRADGTQNVFLMKPDFGLLNEFKQVVMIADAKWKVLNEDEVKLGVSQTDMYQMTAYAMRYGVKRLALVYPEQIGLQARAQFRINGLDAKLDILPVSMAQGARNTRLAEWLNVT